MQFKTSAALSYAQIKNSRFLNTKSHYVPVEKRWNETLAALPAQLQQLHNHRLALAIAEFKRINPHLKTWNDIVDQMVDTTYVPMSTNLIDDTMQRFLDHPWVCDIIAKFDPFSVRAIETYRDGKKLMVWNGQHTIISLYLIATLVYGVTDISTIQVPVNIFKATQKPKIREKFLGFNGGDLMNELDAYDKMEQMVFGVRVDGSQNPTWIKAERKQQIVENHGLFLTKKSLGDYEQDGAISRMQEFNSLNERSLGWLCSYLVAAGCNRRPAEEKELVMMAYFFDMCDKHNISIDANYIINLAKVTAKWQHDFSPKSDFWNKAADSYYSWHRANVIGVNPRFNKEPTHGIPFLISQFKKDLPTQDFPPPYTSSSFVPSLGDLY